jgi:hypothetical protein
MREPEDSMPTRSRKAVQRVVAVVAVFLATGCVVSGANIYDVCSGTEECPDGTTCVPANTTTDGYVGSFCTVSCNADSDCPGDGFAAPVCEAGQCYAGCPGNTGCPYSETCATDGAVLFCVP